MKVKLSNIIVVCLLLVIILILSLNIINCRLKKNKNFISIITTHEILNDNPNIRAKIIELKNLALTYDDESFLLEASDIINMINVALIKNNE